MISWKQNWSNSMHTRAPRISALFTVVIMYHCSTGISLTVEQWGRLKEAIPQIDAKIGSTSK